MVAWSAGGKTFRRASRGNGRRSRANQLQLRGPSRAAGPSFAIGKGVGGREGIAFQPAVPPIPRRQRSGGQALPPGYSPRAPLYGTTSVSLVASTRLQSSEDRNGDKVLSRH